MSKLLETGDVIEIKDGHKVYAQVPQHFIYANKRGVWDTAKADVMVGGELGWLSGTYVVCQITRDGGGAAHDGGYPDGHHVWCERKDGFKVDFYQTGCFTAMIEDIQPVGKASIKTTWEME
ncbi:hypothetical protein N9878_01290 [bacterium]|nr:hypothetical protein [bacterium]